MSLLEGLPVNFTISDRAKAEFEVIRHLYRDQSDNPPAVLMIGWGTTFFDAGGTAEGVVVGYYGESKRAEVEPAVEHVCGVDLVFLITPENHGRFAGKRLDHRPDQGFHLVDPA